MKARELFRILEEFGCERVGQKGSHVKFRCPGGCVTVVPNHPGEELAAGTLGAIQRQLEKCLGERWLQKRTK